MERTKLKELRWYDIASLTAIFFAYAIYTSTMFLISSMSQITPTEQMEVMQDAVEFSDYDNYVTLGLQLVFLLIGFAYLKLRKFDFQVWHIKFSIKAAVWGIVLFFIASLCLDAYTMLVYYVPYLPIFPSTFMQVLGGIKFSTVIYSILNGFYEEIFFLGICTAVQSKYKKWVFIYSLIVRVSFHTYQGISTAIGLGFILGSLFYFLYEKSKTKNLLPFFIAHTIADIFGLSIMGYFQL